MSLAEKIAFILNGKAEFARGGTRSAKGGKSSAKGKKARGVTQAGSGGACCKTEGGKFAPGNNYGSLAGKGNSQRAAANRVKERLAAKAKGANLDKAAREASVKVEATRRGAGPAAAIVARSRKAAVMAARVKAAQEKTALEKRQAKNAKVREKRAEKKQAAKQEAAKPARDRAIGAMVAKSKGAAGKGAAAKAAKAAAKRKAQQERIKERVAGRGSTDRAVGRAAPKSKAQAARADAASKQAAWDSTRSQARPAKSGPSSSRPSREERRRQILERAGDKLADAKDSIGKNKSNDMKRKADGSLTYKAAQKRDNLAAEIKRARKAIQKADPKEKAKLAEQSARVERRRAQQPRLDLTKGDRASAVKGMVAKSKAASEKAGAKNAADGSKASRVAAIKRATDKSRVASGKAGAKNASNKRADAETVARKARNAARDAANPPDRSRLAPGELDARWRAAGIQKQREGGRGAVTPVKPPPASVEARPITDPVRVKAEVRKADQAFGSIPNAVRDNQASLTDLRAAMPHLSRQEFDTLVTKELAGGKFEVYGHGGEQKSMPERIKAGAIRVQGRDASEFKYLAYIARRDS